MLNIKTRAVAPTLKFQLLDADETPLVDEDGKPCMATIYGPGSKQFIAAQAARVSISVTKLQRGKSPQLSADEQISATAKFLTAITVELEVAYDDLEGDEKHMAIYSDPALGFIGDQVAKKAGEWGNFSAVSSKS